MDNLPDDLGIIYNNTNSCNSPDNKDLYKDNINNTSGNDNNTLNKKKMEYVDKGISTGSIWDNIEKEFNIPNKNSGSKSILEENRPIDGRGKHPNSLKNLIPVKLGGTSPAVNKKGPSVKVAIKNQLSRKEVNAIAKDIINSSVSGSISKQYLLTKLNGDLDADSRSVNVAV